MSGLDPRAMLGGPQAVSVPSREMIDAQLQRQDMANMVNACLTVVNSPVLHESAVAGNDNAEALIDRSIFLLSAWLDGFKLDIKGEQ